MRYIDYKQLNPFQKAAYKIKQFILSIPNSLVTFFKFLFNSVVGFFVGIGKAVSGYVMRFVRGDWATKISYLIMGFGLIVKGQIIKGLLYLILQAGYIFFFINFAGFYLRKFITLGDEALRPEINPATGRTIMVPGDRSNVILLYGILSIVVTIVFLAFYFANTKATYKAQKQKEQGNKLPTFLDEVKEYLDSKFHTTLLTIPTLTIGIFTILPIIYMVCMAFTNFDRHHMPPGSLFQWVGFESISEVVGLTEGSVRVAHTFVFLAQWTLLWAVVATFSNYLLGMIFALMINKKGIKLKSLWRTLFVITIAVPQFVSLLLMSQMLSSANGAINTLIEYMGGSAQQFLDGDMWVARITVMVVNCWVGVPYTILITSGILMNIPEDLYESATIDGAGPVRSFFSITLPYMLFVTAPYLISQFIGNINNFNVIYLLTNGGPPDNSLSSGAGGTDLLVTWLFKLTLTEKNYHLASAVSILVFIFCATISLITFNLTKSAKNEEEFS